MKLLALCVVVVAGLCHAPAAEANSACGRNHGVAPQSRAVLPPRAQLVLFDSRETLASEYVATLDNEAVPLAFTEMKAGPFVMRLAQVQSDATGTLRLLHRFQVGSGGAGPPNTVYAVLAIYSVVAKAKMPAVVNATPSWIALNIRHSTVKEEYDALALELDTDLAVRATIKLRRDAKAQWHTLDVPVTPADKLSTRPTLRIGQLGCNQNYTVELFEQGVEIEAQVTLTDGTTRTVNMSATPTTVISASKKPKKGTRKLL